MLVEGAAHVVPSSSSSLAKKDVDFRISFARRNSKFSAPDRPISSRLVAGRQIMPPAAIWLMLPNLLGQRLRVHAEIGGDVGDRTLTRQGQADAAPHELILSLS
jgi:hypothetical protein